MRRTGFFTRASAAEQRKLRKGSGRKAVSRETLRKLGPAAVRGMNPDALSPEMEPLGPSDPLVYVLGEAPTETEDSKDMPFSGTTGRLLRKALPSWGTAETRFDNVVRTLPPKGRKPTAEEVECFRGVVSKSIAEAKPRVVLGLGNVALKWATGLTNLLAARGRKYPVSIAGHVCWFVPTLHPSLLLRIGDERYEKVPADEWNRFWRDDLDAAYALADSDEVPAVVSPAEAKEGIEHVLDVERALEVIEYLGKLDAFGFDVENHHLRPYAAESLLLTIAFSDGTHAWALPWDHSGHRWKPAERERIVAALRKLFASKKSIAVAHNITHDLEWVLYLLGPSVFEGAYGCSMNAAFALNPGPPGDGAAGLALDDLCLEHFGLGLKALSPSSKWVTRLRELAIEKVLDYNALDAKWCLLLWRKLLDALDAEGLRESYDLQIARVYPIVHAQSVGVPINQDVRRRFDEELEGQVAKVKKEIADDERTREWVERVPTFSPSSAKEVGRFLYEACGYKEVRKAKGYSTAAAILEPLRRDDPVVDAILRMRGLEKLWGTYVRRFDPEHPESYVYPDGRIHSSFSIARTRTARLASEDPNGQNWPKRKNKQIREQLFAPEGWRLFSVDQGQIEARVLAMESCDPTWIRMIEDGYDVHQEWAERIAKIDDRFNRLLGENPKAARHKSKNGWVFPSFFGSSIRSIVRNLELSDDRKAKRLHAEFWEIFAGVRKWQRGQEKRYEKDGYVRSLTGRIRRGPLSYNMIINTPIQCTASDICVDAMVRLFWRSVREEKPWLCPVLQIHDDLTSLVPEEELAYAIRANVEEQLGFEAPWVNVPLAVEVEEGPNLYAMSVVGTWTSFDLAA